MTWELLSERLTHPIRAVEQWNAAEVTDHMKERTNAMSMTGKKPQGAAQTAESDVAASATMADWVEMMDTHLRRSYLESTRALVAAVEAKDAFTERHSSRVARYCRLIAERLGLSRSHTESIATSAMLHDIGKIGVPDAILNKPGPLREAEFDIVRRHPSIAIEILGHTTFLNEELPYILHHHERYDGTGYPAGLAGEQIPLGARILAVADSLDAMLSTRSYKAPLTLRRAKIELVRCKGKQFDPKVIDATMAWLEDAPPEEAPEPNAVHNGHANAKS